MHGTLDRAYGYKGDPMNLPVANVEEALPFYETILGFTVVSRSRTPHNAAVLARDGIEMRIAENGGDPSQDGCAFHVTGVESLFAEFKANGLEKPSGFSTERHKELDWKVFYVVAPDGLCYWFGESAGNSGAGSV
jgi:catechol 2,3-dioxygenase-like lactoylglutathione lyase family enzyme